MVVADDHPVVLKGLEAVVATEPDLKIVAACSGGPATVEAVRKHRPDVLVLDLRLSGFDGFQVLRALRHETSSPRAVVLTAEIDDEQTLDALRLGAAGIVLKEMAPRLIVECIRKVHAGQQWVERKSVGRALETLLRRETGLRELTRILTVRELDVVRMVVRGLRNAEIATRMSVSEGTVKSHLHHIYEKLQLTGRAGLMLFAHQKGLK